MFFKEVKNRMVARFSYSFKNKKIGQPLDFHVPLGEKKIKQPPNSL
jgi:hypothetical protein